jgi:hypothetical protein
VTKPVTYSLIHVLSYQEIYTPLVKSQLFEQAYEQLTTSDLDKPKEVQVWIICPFRVYWDKKFNSYLNELKSQFPGLIIRVIGGIDRMKQLPQWQLVYYFRRKFPTGPVVFHFRGDDLLSEFNWLKKYFPSDQHIVDIRGLWPAEFLLEKGIEIDSFSDLNKYPDGQNLVMRLRFNLQFSDALTCVSPALEQLLRTEFDYKNKSWVVPCAVKIESRPAVEFKEDENWTVGYLGGVAKYQNLEELVLPFLNCLHRLENKIRIKLITQQPAEMKSLIQKFNWDPNVVEILSIPQSKVAFQLIKMDLGLMIRKINLVNRVAQPVKIGEYLASGVLVVLQKGLGGISEKISRGLLEVDLNKSDIQTEAEKVLHYLKQSSKAERRNQAIQLSEEFSWKKNAKIHRNNYLELITN